MAYSQLTLGIRLKDSASFANFFVGDNELAVAHARASAHGDGESALYLWGAPGSGKTHVLQAACHEAALRGANPVYLPLRDAAQWQPEMLEGFERCGLVCLDDLDAIAGNATWEEAVFHLYNRVREHGSHIVMAATVPPAELKLKLPDLASRTAWGLVLRLSALSEDGKIAALQLRSHQRGLDLPDDVAQFLLRRAPRDMDSLFNLLEKLDHASLAAQRKLTIPFVRQFI